jgi:hypothetical protein
VIEQFLGQTTTQVFPIDPRELLKFLSAHGRRPGAGVSGRAAD